MKKILSVLLAALLALPMSAQLSRKGDKYFADGQVMKSKQFSTYMQSAAEANLAKQFKSGLTISYVGWGVFAGGIATTTAGLIAAGAIAEQTGNQGVGQAVTGTMVAGITGAIVGGVGAGLTVVGVVCLGVGYDRMHKSADTFIATTHQQPQAYLSVKADQNGLGLAINF